MLKKIFAIGAFAVTLALVGCGGSSNKAGWTSVNKTAVINACNPRHRTRYCECITDKLARILTYRQAGALFYGAQLPRRTETKFRSAVAACGGDVSAVVRKESMNAIGSSSNASPTASSGATAAAEKSGLTAVCNQWGTPGLCTSCYVPALVEQVSKGNISLSGAEDVLNAFLGSDTARTPSWMMGIAANCD